MRRLFSIVALVALFATASALAEDPRAPLEERGLSIGLRYEGEVFANVRGGVKRGAIYEGLVSLSIDADLEKLLGWSGAFVHALGFYPHGASVTRKYSGDLSVVSGIDAYDSVRVFTLWIDQSFFDGKVSLRAGLLDVDDEFTTTEYSAVLLNSDFGEPAALSGNFPVALYEISAPGVRLRIRQAPWCYFAAGAYDGNPAPGVFADPSPRAARSTELNRHGTDWSLRGGEGAFFIGEIGVQINQPKETDGDDRGKKVVGEKRGLAGSYKAGFAYHTDTFSQIYDVTLASLGSSLRRSQPRAADGNYLIYAVVDQELWREPGTEEQGLGVFARSAFTPRGRNHFGRSATGGLHYTGLLPGRDEDEAALGLSWISLSDAVVRATRDANRADGTHFAVPDHEAVLELTYAFRVTPWWRLQPDVQWILHPGGTSERGNAFVIGLRSTFVF